MARNRSGTPIEEAANWLLVEYANYANELTEYGNDPSGLVPWDVFCGLMDKMDDWECHPSDYGLGMVLAINVKYYGPWTEIGDLVPDKEHQDNCQIRESVMRECSCHITRLIQNLSQSFTEQWWEDAEEVANQYHFKIESSGRSGGWMHIGRENGGFQAYIFDPQESWKFLAEYDENTVDELSDFRRNIKEMMEEVQEDYKDFIKSNLESLDVSARS